jgi:hypothetical protein
MKERDHKEDLDVDGRIILIRKSDNCMWIGFMWHKMETIGRISVNTVMNLMGYINCWE